MKHRLRANARRRGPARTIVTLALGLAAACDPGRAVNPDLFLDDALDDLGTPALAQAGARPFTSELEPHPEVRLWISAEAAADYQRIEPARTGSHAIMPRGTIIVREVLDAGGRTARLTFMAKGPPGWNPSIGDWWFAVTRPDGVPETDAGGTPLVGRLAACVDCHDARADDDYLFGVPRAARGAGAGLAPP